MPSLGIAPRPGGCAGRLLIPTQDAAPASGVFPMDADFHHLEIRDQAIQLFTISRGSRSTSPLRLSTIAAFLACYCPRSPFGSQVSHQTQEHPSEFLPAQLGIQRSASWRTYTTSRAGNNRRRSSRVPVVSTT